MKRRKPFHFCIFLERMEAVSTASVFFCNHLTLFNYPNVSRIELLSIFVVRKGNKTSPSEKLKKMSKVIETPRNQRNAKIAMFTSVAFILLLLALSVIH